MMLPTPMLSQNHTRKSAAQLGCVVLPELETLQWGCNYLVETT